MKKSYATVNFVDKLLVSIKEQSTDLDTQVGCVITDKDGFILMSAANHHTCGMKQTKENSSRPEKYDWIEHAERNAIYACARQGVKLAGAVMHIHKFPCVECARAIVQSGISTLFHGSIAGFDPVKYKFDKARKILEASNVKLIDRSDV